MHLRYFAVNHCHLNNLIIKSVFGIMQPFYLLVHSLMPRSEFQMNMLFFKFEKFEFENLEKTQKLLAQMLCF